MKTKHPFTPNVRRDIKQMIVNEISKQKAIDDNKLKKEIERLRAEYQMQTLNVLRHIDMKFKKHEIDVNTLVNNIVVNVREELRAKNRVESMKQKQKLEKAKAELRRMLEEVLNITENVKQTQL